MDIKLRKIKKSDWPQMKKLLQEYSNYHKNIFKQIDPSFAIFETGYQKKDFEKMLNKKRKMFLAACDGDKIVGFILAKIIEVKGDKTKFKQGYLSEIFVTEKYRGKGVSELMWQEVLKWFKKEKVKFIQLSVLANNEKPQQIYKKWGFKSLSLIMTRKL
jgi:ribosomal protein S18 acetylase RimI-like enzyme